MEQKPDPMPDLTAQPPDGQNGHATMPPGAGTIFGVDGESRGGSGQPEYRDFMTAHTYDPARLLAEAYLTPDLLEDYVDVMEDDMAEGGYVSVNALMKTRVAGSIGLGARGRNDAKEVAISPQSVMKRAQSWAKNIFGARGAESSVSPSGQDI